MIDINAALGMVERPLQVGDWVECIRKDGFDWLQNASWPLQVKLIDECGWVAFDDSHIVGDWQMYRFRRVDPPRDRDEVAELRRAIDGWRKLDDTNNRIKDALREQLSQVTKERDELKLQVENDQVVIEEMNRQADQWSKRYRDVRGERDTLREQLATVRAEAAAMRRLIDENDSRLNDLIRRIGASADTGWITHELRHVLQKFNTTAGRELLDEMRRKDERIRELEQRVDELDAECASFADQAYDAAEPEEMSKEEIDAIVSKVVGEQSPVWRYRGHAHCAVWRTCDGKMIEYGGKGVWEKSGVYVDWQDLCANTSTYPCDESGNRIEEQMNVEKIEHVECNCGGTIMSMGLKIEDQTKRIADLERQLADHKRDAELFRELRAWIKNGVFSVVGYSVVIGCQCIPTELAELLISIRDGGAK